MSKRKGSKKVAIAVGVGALLALGGLASAAESGGGLLPGGGGGGGSGGGGSTDPWTPGPGGKGKVFGGGGGGGSGGTMPWGDFDFSGNGLWISPQCDGVVEGALFRPDTDAFSINAIEPSEYDAYEPGHELDAVLKVDPENTVAGFIDWWMDGRELPQVPAFAAWVESHWKSRQLPRPLPSTIEIVAELIRQVSPSCMEIDPLDWGTGLTDWLEDFMLWLDLYLHEWWSDEIAFDLEV